MSDLQLEKLKDQIDNILLNLGDKVSKTKSKTERKSGGIKRGIKSITVEKIYSLIISHAIKEIKSKCKLVRYKDLPLELKNFNKLNTSAFYEKEFNLNFSNEEKKKGYIDKYDGYIVNENKIVMILEYKAYLENAMLKRCLLDAVFAQTVNEKIKYCICMLETSVQQNDRDIGYNSHSLMSFFYEKFKTKIHMLLLLDGKRGINKDITEIKFVKKVNIHKLIEAVNFFKSNLES